MEKQNPPIKAELWSNDQPTTFLATKLKDAKIPYINFYESFYNESKTKTLYKPEDSHWNIAGNRLAATSISDSLIKWRILKKNRQNF